MVNDTLKEMLIDNRDAWVQVALRAQNDLGVGVSVDGASDQAVPEEVEVLAYRVVQESLTNIGKHAMAMSASVRIRWTVSEACVFSPSSWLRASWWGPPA